MNKQEAIEAMEAGNKVTHRYFSRDEWMTMENGKILLEDGVLCIPTKFWQYRTDKSWEDGYSIFLPPIKQSVFDKFSDNLEQQARDRQLGRKY